MGKETSKIGNILKVMYTLHHPAARVRQQYTLTNSQNPLTTLTSAISDGKLIVMVSLNYP